MSEQAKLTYLQERIHEATRKERGGFASFTIGAIMGVIGYFFYAWHVDYYQMTATGHEIFLRSEYPYQLVGIILVILGIILGAIGFTEGIYYMSVRTKSMEELKLMATTNKCPNCGKQILQKTPYCPFCGKPLT